MTRVAPHQIICRVPCSSRSREVRKFPAHVRPTGERHRKPYAAEFGRGVPARDRSNTATAVAVPPARRE